MPRQRTVVRKSSRVKGPRGGSVSRRASLTVSRGGLGRLGRAVVGAAIVRRARKKKAAAGRKKILGRAVGRSIRARRSSSM